MFKCSIHEDQNCMKGVKDVKRNPHAVYFDDTTLTQQHFAEECDINHIIDRAAKTGNLPINDKVPMYGDFTSIPTSLTESFAMIKRAGDLFMSMPWQARERFGNDPQKMIAFLQDSRNRDEAVKLGLVKAPEPLPEADDGPKAKASKDKAPAEEGA